MCAREREGRRTGGLAGWSQARCGLCKQQGFHQDLRQLRAAGLVMKPAPAANQGGEAQSKQGEAAAPTHEL